MKKYIILSVVLALAIIGCRNPIISLAQDFTETLAYVSVQRYNTDIYLFDLHDNTMTRLTFEETNEYAPSWSPDGCLIAHVSYFDIFVHDIANDTSTNLTALVESDASFYNYPSWSPDGRYIAYSSNSGVGFGLHVLDIDTLIDVRVTDPTLTTGASDWSPDSDYLVFDGKINNDDLEIFSIRVDGTDLRNISSHNADDTDSVLSPDGNKIAFSSNRDGDWELYVMDSDGSNVRRLTFDDGVDGEPDWSPDGEQIAFSSDRNGSWELYIMDADGSNVQQLTDEPFVTNQNPVWQPMACER